MRSSIFVFLGLIALMTSCLDGADGLSTDEQMEKDLATIDEYLATNNINAIKDKNGVRYVITEMGTKGFPARADQVIKADYVGKFLDGTTFDDGDAEGPLGGFIRGWQYGLAVWPAGTKGKLFVPSPLGYGTQQINGVPPNSILMFDIKLNEVVQSNADKARFTSDTTAIEKFLADHNIDAETDGSGVRYVITEQGSGAMPEWFSKVKFKYSGTNLVTSTEFSSGTSEPTDSFDSRVADYINGMKVALMKLNVGGKITAYIPSGLAFGPQENSTILLPANSNVKYEIELLEIIP